MEVWSISEGNCHPYTPSPSFFSSLSLLFFRDTTKGFFLHPVSLWDLSTNLRLSSFIDTRDESVFCLSLTSRYRRKVLCNPLIIYLTNTPNTSTSLKGEVVTTGPRLGFQKNIWFTPCHDTLIVLLYYHCVHLVNDVHPFYVQSIIVSSIYWYWLLLFRGRVVGEFGRPWIYVYPFYISSRPCGLYWFNWF